jgi:hypothetical protein
MKGNAAVAAKIEADHPLGACRAFQRALLALLTEIDDEFVELPGMQIPQGTDRVL